MFRPAIGFLVLSITIPLLEAETTPERTGGAREPARIEQMARLQIGLDRSNFGVGLIDGRDGARTRAALADYGRAKGVGEAEARALVTGGDIPPFTDYVVAPSDLDQVGQAPEDWVERAGVKKMAYVSLTEVLSEKFHVSERYLRGLNPSVADWGTSAVGATIRVPNILAGRPNATAVRIEIDAIRFRLRAYDSGDTLVASFPCSVAKDKAKVPAQDMAIAVFAPNPIYVFDPVHFPESPRAQAIGRKLIIPAGPNTPVGTYWLGLSLPGYGIHGTSKPESIGSAESHGCFRLTNWDIVTLAGMVSAGTPVTVLAPRSGSSTNGVTR